MKKQKLLCFILACVMAASFFPASVLAAANQKVNVVINGQPIDLTGQEAQIVNGKTMVPLRKIFEAMEFNVFWDAKDSSATLTKKDTVIYIISNKSYFYLNNAEIPLEVPAQLINGGLYLPLRAISEATGAKVNWISKSKTAEITYKPSVAEIPPIETMILALISLLILFFSRPLIILSFLDSITNYTRFKTSSLII